MNAATALAALEKDYKQRKAELLALQAEAEQRAAQLAQTEQTEQENAVKESQRLAATFALDEAMKGLQREAAETLQVMDQMNEKIAEAEACYQSAKEMQQRLYRRARSAVFLCGQLHATHADAFVNEQHAEHAAQQRASELVVGVVIRPKGMDWHEAKRRGFMTTELVGAPVRQLVITGMRESRAHRTA